MSETIETGSIHEGSVVRIKPFGAIIKLTDNAQGLVHISHISSKYVQDINEHIAVGDVVKVKILSVDNENNKISLSMKDVEDQVKRVYKPRGFSSFDDEVPKSHDSTVTFEDKFKDWLKTANERQAGINKRNKRR